MKEVARLLSVALVAAAVAVVAMGQREPTTIYDSVDARRFILRDDQNRVRAIFATHEESAALWFYDTQARARMKLAIEGDKGLSGLTIYDSAKSPRVILAYGSNGELTMASSLHLCDPVGKASLYLWQARDDLAIVATDRNEKERFSLSASDKGTALEIGDKYGNTRLMADAPTSAPTDLSLWHRGDKAPAWSALPRPAGQGQGDKPDPQPTP